MDKHIPYEQLLNRPCDFMVKYRFYTAEEGGRKVQTFFQGYRSDFMYYEDQISDGIYAIHPEFLDKHDQVISDNSNPVAQAGKAKMWILNTKFYEYHKSRLTIGSKGYFMEGAIKVAECEVIKLNL